MHLWTKYENSNTQFKVWWIIEIIVKVMSIKILIKEYSQLWSLDSVLNWTYLILQVFKGIGYMVLQLIKDANRFKLRTLLHAERYICSAPGCSYVGSDRLQMVTGYFSLKPWDDILHLARQQWRPVHYSTDPDFQRRSSRRCHIQQDDRFVASPIVLLSLSCMLFLIFLVASTQIALWTLCSRPLLETSQTLSPLSF